MPLPLSATMISTAPVDAPARGTRQDYDLATVLRRCARIATQIEESEVKILWIGHKIGNILGSLGVK
jgi:hypothetical protein